MAGNLGGRMRTLLSDEIQQMLLQADQVMAERRKAHDFETGNFEAERMLHDLKSTPHHFVLTDAAVYESQYDTNTKMAPPLRSQEDLEACLEGLRDGTIDAIATDHAPHHANEKAYEFDKAPNGIVGLETAVSLTLDRLVHRGIISMSRMIELLSCNPSRIFKLNRGTLQVGAIADMTIFNPNLEITIDAKQFKSKSKNMPFDGWKLKGAPAATIVSGRVVWGR